MHSKKYHAHRTLLPCTAPRTAPCLLPAKVLGILLHLLLRLRVLGHAIGVYLYHVLFAACTTHDGGSSGLADDDSSVVSLQSQCRQSSACAARLGSVVVLPRAKGGRKGLFPRGALAATPVCVCATVLSESLLMSF